MLRTSQTCRSHTAILTLNLKGEYIHQHPTQVAVLSGVAEITGYDSDIIKGQLIIISVIINIVVQQRR